MPQIRNNRSKKSRNNPMRGRRGVREAPAMPTQINMHPISNRVYRFIAGAEAATYNITRRCLLSLQGVTGGVATGWTIIQAIRVKRVSAWFLAPSGALMASINVEWTDIHGPAIQKTATATNVVAGHLSTRPPQGSFAGMWSQVTATGTYNEIVFTITTQNYTTIDVECEVVYADGTVANSETISRGNSTAPQVGYSDLDNSSVAGGVGTNQLNVQSDAIITWTT